MSIYTRFFGKFEDDDNPDTDLVATSDDENPLGLVVLFSGALELDADAIAKALQSLHSELSEARCELAVGLEEQGNVFGLVGWGEHVVKLIGFDNPMPEEPVELCVAPSHYARELKELARAHASHLLLWYAGSDESVLEQYVVLALVAGAMAHFGGLVVLNESARTSFPAAGLSNTEVTDNLPDTLRALPWPILYCGFVKYEVEGVEGVWMRTYGAYLFSLPNFAVLASGHDQGQLHFDAFDSILKYLHSSGAMLEAGHTLQIEEDVYFRFRDPEESEYYLESEGDLLVAERIGPDEVNR